MKWIVVFGGAFNPPTNAHFWLAEHMVNEFPVEKVLFMPVGNWYPKPGLLSSFHREGMLETVINSGQGHQFELCTVETSSQAPRCTYESLRLVQRQYPRHPVGFLMGSDNLRQLSSWQFAEQLLTEFSFFVVARGGDDLQTIIRADALLSKHADHIIAVPLGVRHEDSSTYVRQLLAEGKSVRFLVPNSVLTFIQSYGLYQTEKDVVS